MGEWGSLELDVEPRLALILVLLCLPPKWDYHAQLKVMLFPKGLSWGVCAWVSHQETLTAHRPSGWQPHASFPALSPEPGRQSNLQ